MPVSEVLEVLSSGDSVIRQFVNGEFGYSYFDNFCLYSSNDISEHVRI